jgi:two-component system, NtrC family, response regulator GlrR
LQRIKKTTNPPFKPCVPPSPLKSPPRPPVRPSPKPGYGGTIVYDDDFDTPTRLHQQFVDEPTRFGRMVGRSAVTRSLFELLQRASASDATVLIEGETGTGKEATAEAIHYEGQRKNGPFVVIDCGAIPPQLLESELFGHERGAFTGAIATRQGAFEAASGGTIFLDEIGELTLDLQPKILRVLERRQVKPVGSTTYETIDVRVIAATNKSLRAEVQAHRFRSDLYYRLAVVQVKLPPLRERIADIPILVDHVLESLEVADQPIAATLRSADFLNRVTRYSWPGNVRQLRNYIERCVALDNPNLPPNTDTKPPEQPAVTDSVDISQPLKVARDQCVSNFERRYLEELLHEHNNNVTAAARAAEVDRIHFHRLLRKHGLREYKPYKPGDGSEE